MAITSSILSWIVPARAQSLAELGIELSDERIFLPGFVATCLKPSGYSISFEDNDVLAFENQDGSVLIRLSSLSVQSKSSLAPAFEDIRDNLTGRTRLYLNQSQGRALSLNNEIKSDADHIFYSSIFGEEETAILTSITIEKKKLKTDVNNIGNFFENFSMTFQLANESTKLLEDMPGNLDVNKSTFEENELEEFLLMRRHARRLVSATGSAYPPSASKLDELFKKAIGNPEAYSGLEAVQVAIGVAFGDLLASQFGFQWAYVEDEFGRDLAIARNPSGDDLRIFPVDVVRKRTSVEDSGFMSALVTSLPEFFEKHN